MNAHLSGRVRKILEAIDASAGGDDEQITINQQMELLTAPGSSPYEEVVRPGRAFWTGTTAAQAALVAIPTTVCSLALYNMDVDGGRSLVIDWVAAQNVVSTAVAAEAQIICLVGQQREVSPTDAALTIKKCNGVGGGTNDTKARTVTAALPTTQGTGVAANWFPWGPNGVKPGVAATPGYGCWAEVNGRFIIPPGRYFAMNVVANVAGETFVSFVGWHEKQIVLG